MVKKYSCNTFNSTSFLCLNSSGTLEVEKRTLGTGAFGPTPVGAYLPLTGGTLTGPVAMSLLISLALSKFTIVSTRSSIT